MTSEEKIRMQEKQLNNFINQLKTMEADPNASSNEGVSPQEINDVLKQIITARDLLNQGKTRESTRMMNNVSQKVKSWPMSPLATGIVQYASERKVLPTYVRYPIIALASIFIVIGVYNIIKDGYNPDSTTVNVLISVTIAGLVASIFRFMPRKR